MATRTYRETHYPSDTMDICEENIEMFFRFMYERHMIWHNRFVKKLPKKEWTDGEVKSLTDYVARYSWGHYDPIATITKWWEQYKQQIK
jgi:hypothetical protein